MYGNIQKNLGFICQKQKKRRFDTVLLGELLQRVFLFVGQRPGLPVFSFKLYENEKKIK